MPHDIAIFDTYIPILFPLFIVGMAITWLVDRILSLTGIYRFVWHPSLMRAGVLVCICCSIALQFYR